MSPPHLLRPPGRRIAVGVTIALAAVIGGPQGVGAAGTGVYSTWTTAGSAGTFSGTATVAVAGFPAATFASTQRTVGTASSATLTGSTPFGAAYGTSSAQQYASLGTSVSNLTPQSTTLTFASPTPSTGWGFALGDVDAESVRISATGTDGSPVALAALGFRGAFNYSSSGTDLPTWDPTTGTAIGNPCPASPAPPDCDTNNGASVWFQPNEPLGTLTLDFTVQGGAPQFQLWIAANSATIAGTVVAPPAPGLPPSPVPDATVTVSTPEGGEIATTVTGSDGSFVVPPVLAGPEYVVTVDPPDGSAAVETTFTVDTADGDVGGLTLTLEPVAAPATTTTSSPSSTTTTSRPVAAARSLALTG